MKKFITLIAILVLAFSVASAQNIKVGQSDYFVKESTARTVAAASVSTIFDLTEWGETYYYTVVAKMNSPVIIAGSPAPLLVTATLKYSLDGSLYFPLDTITYAGSASDTSMNFLEITTDVGYPYLGLFIDAPDSVSVNVTDVVGRFVTD